MKFGFDCKEYSCVYCEWYYIFLSLIQKIIVVYIKKIERINIGLAVDLLMGFVCIKEQISLNKNVGWKKIKGDLGIFDAINKWTVTKDDFLKG